METQTVRNEKSKIIEQHGDWTSHNIHIAEDLYTIGEHIVSEKLVRILQIVADLAGERLENLRILDLACLEGQYAVEFARHGARAVGIEGRASNLSKANFVKQALALGNLELYHDDVRNLSREKYGEFDVVLCLGILYHLDAPDVCAFVERISEVCTRFAVFDTYVSITSKESCDHQDKTYYGRFVQEHEPGAGEQARLKKRWASLDNAKSFWISRPSLYNLLLAAGFTSVYQCDVPVELGKPADRVTLVALKGRRQTVISIPKMNLEPHVEMPEDFQPQLSVTQNPRSQLSKRVLNLFPLTWRKTVKRGLRKLGLISGPSRYWMGDA